MEKIYLLMDELNSLIKNDQRIILLNDIEKEMENNDEVMRLSYIKDIKETNYNDTLKHYPSSSKEVKKAQKDLYLAKKELDSFPLVKKYLQVYKKVRELYDELNKILFSCLYSEGKKICE